RHSVASILSREVPLHDHRSLGKGNQVLPLDRFKRVSLISEKHDRSWNFAERADQSQELTTTAQGGAWRVKNRRQRAPDPRWSWHSNGRTAPAILASSTSVFRDC